MSRSPCHSQNCLKSVIVTIFRPSGQTLLPRLWSVCPLGTGPHLFVYEWASPQLALLPAQQYPITSLGFPPAAGRGHLLIVQCQQPKHGGRLEIFGPIDPTAAELEENREWELELDERGCQPLPGPSSSALCVTVVMPSVSVHRVLFVRRTRQCIPHLPSTW